MNYESAMNRILKVSGRKPNPIVLTSRLRLHNLLYILYTEESYPYAHLGMIRMTGATSLRKSIEIARRDSLILVVKDRATISAWSGEIKSGTKVNMVPFIELDRRQHPFGSLVCHNAIPLMKQAERFAPLFKLWSGENLTDVFKTEKSERLYRRWRDIRKTELVMADNRASGTVSRKGADPVSQGPFLSSTEQEILANRLMDRGASYRNAAVRIGRAVELLSAEEKGFKKERVTEKSAFLSPTQLIFLKKTLLLRGGVRPHVEYILMRVEEAYNYTPTEEELKAQIKTLLDQGQYENARTCLDILKTLKNPLTE